MPSLPCLNFSIHKLGIKHPVCLRSSTRWGKLCSQAEGLLISQPAGQCLKGKNLVFIPLFVTWVMNICRFSGKKNQTTGRSAGLVTPRRFHGVTVSGAGRCGRVGNYEQTTFLRVWDLENCETKCCIILKAFLMQISLFHHSFTITD